MSPLPLDATASQLKQMCWDRWGEAERRATARKKGALAECAFWRRWFNHFEALEEQETHRSRLDELATAVTVPFGEETTYNRKQEHRTFQLPEAMPEFVTRTRKRGAR